ncbi:hypothetical protein BGZ73_003272 [Actinomortierella ambigua]|nr:hypothetical protein BGZ73_003272 [Actinomortierella ambigua]
MSSPLNPSNTTNAPTQSLTEQEKRLQKMYGGIPPRKDLLGHKLKERKYFDSGDYALSKAGKTSAPVGSQHPQPQDIPHSSPAQSNAAHGSPPVKESSLGHETEISEDATAQPKFD